MTKKSEEPLFTVQEVARLLHIQQKTARKLRDLVKNQAEPLINVKEAAELLHVHNNTVRRWSDLGVIKTYRVSKRGDRRFKREDILNFLEMRGFNDLTKID